VKAVVYEAFGAAPRLMDVDDPRPAPDGVVIE
jgi:alcohol dehydrogenase